MEFLAKLAGKRDAQQPKATRYEEFLASVRVERERLETLVASIKGDDAEAVPRVIARLEERAAALSQMLDEIGMRTELARQSTAGVDAIETRIAALEGLVLRAEVRASEDAQRSEEMGRRSELLRELVANADRTLERLDGKLGDLSQCQVLSLEASTDLQSLTALAERVNGKLKALENQQQTVDRALLDSRRVSEMVWEMDAQIVRLREGSTAATRVEDTLARLDVLYQTVTGKLETADRDCARFADTVEQQRERSSELLHAVQSRLDRLAVNRSELDTLAERIAAAESGLSNTDRQLAALAASEQALSALETRLDAFGSRADTLGVEIARIEQRQPFLTALDTRLGELDGEIRRTTIRVDGLIRRRQEIDAVKAEFDSCEATYAHVRARADELREQKQQFTAFVEQARTFLRDTPEIESAMRQLKERVTDTGDLAERAIAMRPQIEDLGSRLEHLTPRLSFMEQVHSRLRTLNDLSGDIDHRLAAQVGRQADLEQARVACDGLGAQIVDAQQKLAALEGAQARLAALPEQMAEIQASLADARQSAATIQQGQDAVVEHKRHLAEIHESAAALFADLGARFESLQAVQVQLAHAEGLKDDLYRHLAEIHNIEREAFERHQEAESLLEQCTARWRQVDERRADLAAVEQAVAGVDARIQILDRLTIGLDARIASIGDRDRIVDAVKQEIESVHEIARRCHDDTAAIADQRATVGQTRADLERLTAVLATTDEKLNDVERRSVAVEDVRRKADAVVRLLDDVRVTLDTVSEQKAVADHVTEMLAQFEDAITEARGTTRALQAERKLAQRIVDNVRNIHARAGVEVGQAG
jgi:DNA repair exonuclease SbcCD ATPase subunit